MRNGKCDAIFFCNFQERQAVNVIWCLQILRTTVTIHHCDKLAVMRLFFSQMALCEPFKKRRRPITTE